MLHLAKIFSSVLGVTLTTLNPCAVSSVCNASASRDTINTVDLMICHSTNSSANTESTGKEGGYHMMVVFSSINFMQDRAALMIEEEVF